MPITGSAGASVSFADQGASDTESSNISIGQALAAAFADGVGAGQVNAIWQDTRPLLSNTNETLDFSPTVASGRIGVVTFVRVKAVYIAAAPTNTTDITVTKGANGMNIFTGTTPGLAPLRPGCMFVFVDNSATGVPLVAGTADSLTIANSTGATGNYTIIVAGCLT